MKLIITTVPMKKNISSLFYPVVGNSLIEYSGEVLFPVNAVLAKTFQKGEQVKVLFLSTSGSTENYSKDNIELFKAELIKINAGIGADISWEIIDVPFDPQIEIFEQLASGIISKFEKNCQVIADITYGIKPLPMILICALQFAEKFFDASILNIIYGKVEFNQQNKPINPKLYDISSLFYLNKLIGAMECESGEIALKILNDFFKM
jgi:hypothetical protein